MNSPDDGTVDSRVLSTRNKAGHDEEHRESLTEGADEEELASTEAVDQWERDTGREGVDGCQDSSEDEGELTFESEVILENGSTIDVASDGISQDV